MLMSEKEVEWLSCQKHLETRLKNIKKGISGNDDFAGLGHVSRISEQ